RYNGIMFTHDLKSAKVSKGFESPNLQGRVHSMGSSIMEDASSCTNVDLFLPSSKLSTWLGWEMFACVEHVLIALIEVEGCDEHWGSIVGLSQSKMIFHQALDLILKLNEAAVRCTRDFLRQRDYLYRLSEIPWVVPTFVVIKGEDIVAKFCGSFRQKELSNETSSKILLCGDGSCWKTFKQRYNGIMFTHDLKSAKVSKGFESPNLQGRVHSLGSSIMEDASSCTNAELFFPSSKLSTWLGWEIFAYVEHVLIALIEVEGCDEHWGSIVGLSQSKMIFHQALDLILKLNEAAVRCTQDFLRQRDYLDRLSEIPWVVLTFVVIKGEDIVAKFYGSSRQKELSNETSSKILLCGDGSCWKTFKQVASLIAKEKLK
nr:hypothetical protein [Tanacetum cinerariifolium]